MSWAVINVSWPLLCCVNWMWDKLFQREIWNCCCYCSIIPACALAITASTSALKCKQPCLFFSIVVAQKQDTNKQGPAFVWGAILNALFSAKWFRCSSFLKESRGCGGQNNCHVHYRLSNQMCREAVMFHYNKSSFFFFLFFFSIRWYSVLVTIVMCSKPEGTFHSCYQVVKDIEGGLSLRPSAHPHFLQEHCLPGHSRAGC